jgi:hypothetical protein
MQANTTSILIIEFTNNLVSEFVHIVIYLTFSLNNEKTGPGYYPVPGLAVPRCTVWLS